LTDVVFPAFLFITGMSIPLAIGARLRAGASRATIVRHILVRSLSLIIIGVLMVNAEQGNAPGVMSPDAWNTLMTIAVLLAWQAPTDRIRRWRPAMIALGVLALVGLAFLYRSTDATGVIQLRPQWWGILGLIGWSYLVASVIYLAAGDRPPVLIGATALLNGLFFADAFGLIPTVPYVHVGSTLGSHAALVVSGAVITAWFARYRTGSRFSGTVRLVRTGLWRGADCCWLGRSSVPRPRPRFLDQQAPRHARMVPDFRWHHVHGLGHSL
jgi:heparan-alpha-glucosaminide N-acetyltransferase